MARDGVHQDYHMTENAKHHPRTIDSRLRDWTRSRLRYIDAGNLPGRVGRWEKQPTVRVVMNARQASWLLIQEMEGDTRGQMPVVRDEHSGIWSTTAERSDDGVLL